MNLSFSGCGFLGIYHLGVAKTLASDGKECINQISRFGGASAGALIASLFAVHGPDEQVIETCKKFCLNLAKETKCKTFGVFTPGVELLVPVEKFLQEQFPVDAHIRATGRLFISVTNVDTTENEIISEFLTREVLIKYLLASSCVPYITNSKSITIGDKKYCDGGLTNNLPTFHDGETICVSPFESNHEICPSVSLSPSSPSSSSSSSFMLSSPSSSSQKINRKGTHITIANQNYKINLDNLMRGIHIFSPPTVKILTQYYHQGKRDARKFLIGRGYIGESYGKKKMNRNQNSSDESLGGSDDDDDGKVVSNSFCNNCQKGEMSKCTSVDHYHDASDVMMINVESSVDG